MMNAGMGCVGYLLLYLVCFFVGAQAIHYDVTFWAEYIKGHAVFVPMLPCWVAATIFGGPGIGIAVLTWLISFAL